MQLIIFTKLFCLYAHIINQQTVEEVDFVVYRYIISKFRENRNEICLSCFPLACSILAKREACPAGPWQASQRGLSSPKHSCTQHVETLLSCTSMHPVRLVTPSSNRECFLFLLRGCQPHVQNRHKPLHSIHQISSMFKSLFSGIKIAQ